MADQMPFHFADPLDPRIADYLARTADAVYAPDSPAARCRDGVRWHRGGAIGSSWSRAPTLVLAGRHDRACTVEAAEAIAAGIDGAELVVFERSAHMAFVEEPEAYIATIRSFLLRHV